jgi:hypothetical protein
VRSYSTRVAIILVIGAAISGVGACDPLLFTASAGASVEGPMSCENPLPGLPSVLAATCNVSFQNGGFGLAFATASVGEINYGGTVIFNDLICCFPGGELQIEGSGSTTLTLTYRVPINAMLIGSVTVGENEIFRETGDADTSTNFGDSVSISTNQGVFGCQVLGALVQLGQTTRVNGSCTAKYTFFGGTSPDNIVITMQGGFSMGTSFTLDNDESRSGTFDFNDPFQITGLTLAEADGTPLDVSQFATVPGVAVTPDGFISTPEPPTEALVALGLIGSAFVRSRRRAA